MIETPTVLILGAGASYPYRFPLGEELLRDMCTHFADRHHDLFKQLTHLSGRQAHEIRDFAKALRLSGQQSVDTFLEKRSEFLGIGKEAISCVLVPREKNEIRLFGFGSDEHWYKYLFNKMNAESLEEFQDNKVSFITFNYDRSLEHFLFVSLQNSYNEDDEKTAKALRAIPIVHVYGQLGKHPYVDKEGRSYGQPLADKNDLDRCVAEIKLFPENVPVHTFSKAHRLLEQAKKVVFLGFGYHRTNLERLELDRIPKKASMISGTAVNLEDGERVEVMRWIEELSERQINLWNDNVYMAIRKYGILNK